MGTFPPRPGSADALFAEWLKRRGDPAPDSFDSLLQAHPKHTVPLCVLHEQWQRMEPMLRLAGFDPTAPASFAERLRAAHGPDVDPAITLDAPSADLGKASSELLKRLGKKSTGSRYRLEGEVARGGMGAILRVWDEDIRRHLAMKVVLGKGEAATESGTPGVEPAQLARFLEEAQVTGQLDHPGIVPVHELGIDKDGRVFFTMKLVKGRDLKSIYDLVFEGKEGWNETRALTVLLKVCEAVAYAHKKGVIHRDLKPSNVMVGDFGEVYVMDWGLARVVGRKDHHDIRVAPEGGSSKSVRTERRDEREGTPDSPIVTMDGDVVGTPAYMSPEQARGELEKLDARSDVYAIGAMLYHLIARQVPFTSPGERASNRTVYARLMDGPPKSIRMLRAGVAAEVEAICEKAMNRNESLRYPNTLDFADDLRAYLEGHVVRAYETGSWAEARKWLIRNRILASALVGIVIALVAGTVVSAAFAIDAKSQAQRADGREREARVRALFQDLDVLESLDDSLDYAQSQSRPATHWWIDRARSLVHGTPDLVGGSQRWSPGLADVEALLSQVGSRGRSAQVGTASSASDLNSEDKWWHDRLTELVLSIRTLDARLAVAVESTQTPSADAQWNEAVAAIGQLPQYSGLHLSPQLGLLPLGADPESGLWEFAHLQTGTPMQRAYNGRLVPRPENGLVFVLLPGGYLPVEVGHLIGPEHREHIPAFFVSKYEMTREQFALAAGIAGFARPSSADGPVPVSGVSWHDASASLALLGFWVRLPSMIEWEYACRAGTTSIWWTGDDRARLPLAANLNFKSAGTATRTGWWRNTASPFGPFDWQSRTSLLLATPLRRIGSLEANPFGIHDVYGNVSEWCANVLLDAGNPVRCVRGGCYRFAPQAATSRSVEYIPVSGPGGSGVSYSRPNDTSNSYGWIPDRIGVDPAEESALVVLGDGAPVGLRPVRSVTP